MPKVQVEVGAPRVFDKAVFGGQSASWVKFKGHVDVFGGGERGVVDLGHPLTTEVFVQPFRARMREAFDVVSAAQVLQGAVDQIVEGRLSPSWRTRSCIRHRHNPSPNVTATRRCRRPRAPPKGANPCSQDPLVASRPTQAQEWCCSTPVGHASGGHMANMRSNSGAGGTIRMPGGLALRFGDQGLGVKLESHHIHVPVVPRGVGVPEHPNRPCDFLNGVRDQWRWQRRDRCDGARARRGRAVRRQVAVQVGGPHHLGFLVHVGFRRRAEGREVGVGSMCHKEDCVGGFPRCRWWRVSVVDVVTSLPSSNLQGADGRLQSVMVPALSASSWGSMWCC